MQMSMMQIGDVGMLMFELRVYVGV